MFYDVKKGPLKTEENIFQISAKSCLKKNAVAQVKRVGLNLRYNFLELGGNSEQNGNVQIFV